jgi:hypothetical protein
MDGNIGNLIFWGVVVISIITRIVKSVNKGKEEKQVQQKPLSPQTSTQTPPQLIKVKKQETIAPPPPFPKKQTVPVMEAAEEEKIEEIGLEEFTASETFEFDLSDISEAKKAVIYSEILNRKY